MALNGDALGSAIKTAIDLVGAGLPDEQRAQVLQNRDLIFKAMGNAIVTYLIANTDVVAPATTGLLAGTTPVTGPSTWTKAIGGGIL